MPAEDADLLTPAEVALKFAVTPSTVTRWANQGKLRAVMTSGGHRRFLAAHVDELIRLNQERHR